MKKVLKKKRICVFLKYVNLARYASNSGGGERSLAPLQKEKKGWGVGE
jgi:hypothetical protein